MVEKALKCILRSFFRSQKQAFVAYDRIGWSTYYWRPHYCLWSPSTVGTTWSPCGAPHPSLPPCCVLRGAQWQSTEWIVLTPSLLCRLYLLCEALFLFITTCSVDSAASRRRDENMYTAVRHYFLSFGFLIYWSNRGAKSLKIVSAGSQCVVFVSSESWTTPRHLFTLLRCQNEKANRSREFCRMR